MVHSKMRKKSVLVVQNILCQKSFCGIWEEYACLLSSLKGFHSCRTRGRFVSASYFTMSHRIARKHKAALEIHTLLCKYVCMRIHFSHSVTAQQQEPQNGWYFTCLKVLCLFLFKQTILWKQHNCGKWLPKFYLSVAVFGLKGFWRQYLH